MTEDHWLDEAIRLAFDNTSQGDPPFAALVVRDQHVVASAVDRTLRDLDPTAHAELLAIRAACRALRSQHLGDCLLVTSSEPCPLCQAAALLAGVPRCIYATRAQTVADAGALHVDLEAGGLARELALPVNARQRFVLEHRSLPFGRAPLDAWRRLLPASHH